MGGLIRCTLTRDGLQMAPPFVDHVTQEEVAYRQMMRERRRDPDYVRGYPCLGDHLAAGGSVETWEALREQVRAHKESTNENDTHTGPDAGRQRRRRRAPRKR